MPGRAAAASSAAAAGGKTVLVASVRLVPAAELARRARAAAAGGGGGGGPEGAGFGPDHLRVAVLDPLRMPNGCRFLHAQAARADMAVVHANCRTGWLWKVLFLARHGYWLVRLWRDAHVKALAAVLAVAVAARVAAGGAGASGRQRAR